MSSSVIVQDLLDGGWRNYSFGPFQPGVDICWLLEGEPGIALLRYEAGAQVDNHRHAGLETILILDGSQSDQNGRHKKGTYIANREGSEHSVWSEEGCVVLIQWQKPVVFTDRTENEE